MKKPSLLVSLLGGLLLSGCGENNTDTASQLTEAADKTGINETRQVAFAFENGRVCGFEEEVPGE